MYTDPNEQHSSLFRYTSGRWLWDEEQQLLDRYKVFNVEELQRVAAASVEAHACLDIQKHGEGGYNKVFRLTMDNGMVVIARIPNPNARPAGYMTASEVATMDFVSDLFLLSWLSLRQVVGSVRTANSSAKSPRLGF